MQRFARILSVLFHPLWMPLVIYLIVRTANPYYIGSVRAEYFVFLLLIINIIAPALSLFVMVRYRILSGMEMPDRRERLIPYMLVLFYYITSYIMIRWYGPLLPQTVFSFFLAIIVSIACIVLINLFWKISVHMAAQGGVFGALLGLNAIQPVQDLLLPVCVLVVAAFVAFARLELKAHTSAQVYAGFVLGVFVNWLIISSRIMI